MLENTEYSTIILKSSEFHKSVETNYVNAPINGMPNCREGWQTQGLLTFSIFCVNSRCCEAALCGQSLSNAPHPELDVNYKL
jgi:hypothetical protein